MRSDRYAYRPSGSIGDLTRAPSAQVVRPCVDCGAGVDSRRRYCRPCTAERHRLAMNAYKKERRRVRRESGRVAVAKQ